MTGPSSSPPDAPQPIRVLWLIKGLGPGGAELAKPGERAVFEGLPEASRNEAFLRAWVRKEAFLKATGEGLYRSLADVEVTFAPGEGARLLAVGDDACEAQRWSMTSVVPCAGFTGAVVAEAPAHDLAFHGFHGFQSPQARA